MKKEYIKTYTYLLSTLLILSISACKKDNFLNVPPKGSLTDATTFSSESNADLFVNDIYKQLPDIYNEDQVMDQYTDNDFAGASWMIGQSIVRSNAISPNNIPSGPMNSFNWALNYSIIRKCNVFLQEAAKNKSNFSATWYTQRVGEVTFLRAYFYSILYTNYGGLPLIITPLDNADGSNIFVSRSTADQTASFIETDCDAAAAALPDKPSETGRATKGAALTLKGWIELFAASPLSNTKNDPALWAKAAATNLLVINSGQYSLFSDYQNQFLSANNWNTETIFARGYALPNNGNKKEGMLGPVIVQGSEQAWGNLAPTQSLVNDYETDNGKPITDPTSGYDPQNPYVHRELRFYESVVYDGSEWQGDTWESRIGGNNQIDLGSSSDISNTGYNGKKLLDESINGQTSLGTAPGTSNYIIFRYAEVLLSYAEAQNEAVGPDQSVYDAVNRVRARVSLPPVIQGLSQSDMRTVIHRERRVELAFEDKRWYDIRRWDITTKGQAVLTSPEYGMEITVDPTTKKLVYTPVQIFKNSYSEYMNWLPIPQSVIEQNKNLTQNPGY
jgi:hypothetical protein